MVEKVYDEAPEECERSLPHVLEHLDDAHAELWPADGVERDPWMAAHNVDIARNLLHEMLETIQSKAEGKTMSEWVKSSEQAPPKDGPFWGWLNDGGIHWMQWLTAEQIAEEYGGTPAEYEGCYCIKSDPADDYLPQYWAAMDAISIP